MEGSPQSTLNLKKVGDKVILRLCLEVLFMLIKNNKNIKGIKILENTFLYTAYADDKTFFLKDKNSIKELLQKHFCFFLTYSKLFQVSVFVV